MKKSEEPRDYYEMRRGGEVLVGSPVPNLGYPISWIRDMAKHGIHMYKNGKRVKLCDIMSQ